MKGSLSTDTVRWAGQAWIGPGIGIFHGRAGHQESAIFKVVVA